MHVHICSSISIKLIIIEYFSGDSNPPHLAIGPVESISVRYMMKTGVFNIDIGDDSIQYTFIK